jgi:3D (Asp-Asp-Asp) domain-containing protein
MLTACKEKSESIEKSNWDWIATEVTASAYNSVAWQTKSVNPNIAAWGDTLKPGMKCIAVSRDLLRQGLRHNTMVMIDTFPDTFYVKDKMNKRWKNRIDIYMGKDIKKAREWGKRKLDICYAVPIDTINPSK